MSLITGKSFNIQIDDKDKNLFFVSCLRNLRFDNIYFFFWLFCIIMDFLFLYNFMICFHLVSHNQGLFISTITDIKKISPWLSFSLLCFCPELLMNKFVFPRLWKYFLFEDLSISFIYYMAHRNYDLFIQRFVLV